MNLNDVIKDLEAKIDKIDSIVCEPYIIDSESYNGCDRCKIKYGALSVCPKEYADKLVLAVEVLANNYKTAELIAAII